MTSKAPRIQKSSRLLFKLQNPDIMMKSSSITKRKSIPLSDIELRKCSLKHTMLKCEFDLLGLDAPDPIIHTNQHFAGIEILRRYHENPRLLLCMALGYTQCGKTGVMLSCIKEFTNVDVAPVPVDNIFIITGLSSCEWKKQTQHRLPGCLKDNVLHRPDLKRELPIRTTGKHNILILIDEVQVACGEKQGVSKILSELGYMDIDYLLEHDIKIVEFSATPNGTAIDCERWEAHSDVVYIKPGTGYVGCKDLLAQGRIRECRDLSGPDSLNSIEEISKCIDEHFPDPKYHLIRTKPGGAQEETILNFQHIFTDIGIIRHNQSSPMDIDALLSTKPEKHTFIFLKEMARCAKTFKKEHIGIWYERRAKTMMDDVVVQGLLGRATGYDDIGNSIIFADISSVNRYIELFDSQFSKECQWKSNSTKKDKFTNGTMSKGTFNGLVSDEPVPVHLPPPVKEFRGPDGNGYSNSVELINVMKDHLKTTDYSARPSIAACTPSPPGSYYISSTIAGTIKAKKDPNQRLLLDKYNSMSLNTCVTKEGRCWVVCPVYIDDKSGPEDVRWFGRCLI